MTTAMLAASRSPRPDQNALRVAIARAGRIDREWVIESGEVTFGRSEVADVVIADHDDRETTLLSIEDGTMTLNVPAGASGRLALESGTIDLAAHASQSITLANGARGRIVLAGTGEQAVAVLFQRVAAAEKRQRPVLPAVVRGGLFHRVDWLFTALAAASFMAHLTFVVGLSNSDWPVQSVAVIDQRYATTIYSPAIEPPTPPVVDTQPSEQTTPTAPTHETHSSTPSATHSSSHAVARPATPDDPALAATQAIDAVQNVIGASGLSGALADVLRGGAPTIDAASVLATATGVTVATSDQVAMRDGHPSGDPTFQPRAIGTTPGERREGGDVTETGPHRPQIALAQSEDPPDQAVFDDALLRRALRARMSSIQQCYEHELTRTPGLAGRISLSMQVERSGSLSHVEANDTMGARGLSDCVVNNVRSIRLPVGPTEPVTVEYPLVFAPQS